jgi:hypothetical protein
MTQLTNQEIFDKALFGIREQGYEQSSRDYGCAYRGNGGLKCAVGHCIDDETANSWDSIVGHGTSIVSMERYRKAEYEKFFSVHQLNLLTELQRAHDGIWSVNGAPSFEREMKRIAERWNLTYTETTQTVTTL